MNDSHNDTQYDIVMLTAVHSALDDRILHREAKTSSDAGLPVCVVGPHSISQASPPSISTENQP